MLVEISAARRRALELMQHVNISKKLNVFINLLRIWYRSMDKGSYPFAKAYSDNGIRLNLHNFILKVLPLLKPDLSNFSEAVFKAIEKCGKNQTSVRKHIKYASISFAKVMVERNLLDQSILDKLAKYQIKRFIEPFRPVIRYAEFLNLLKIIEIDIKDQYLNILYRLLLTWLFYTGMRASEACAINIDDIDLNQNTILIRHRKGGKHAVIGLHREIKPLLIEYLKVRPNTNFSNLFIQANKNKYDVNRLSKVVKKLNAIIGINASCHSYRRAFCCFALERNVPVVEVQQMLSHSNIQTTLNYYRPDHEAIIKRMVNW